MDDVTAVATAIAPGQARQRGEETFVLGALAGTGAAKSIVQRNRNDEGYQEETDQRDPVIVPGKVGQHGNEQGWDGWLPKGASERGKGRFTPGRQWGDGHQCHERAE